MILEAGSKVFIIINFDCNSFDKVITIRFEAFLKTIAHEPFVFSFLAFGGSFSVLG